MLKLEVGCIYKSQIGTSFAFFKVTDIEHGIDDNLIFIEILYSNKVTDKNLMLLESEIKGHREWNITESNVGEITLAMLGKDE